MDDPKQPSTPRAEEQENRRIAKAHSIWESAGWKKLHRQKALQNHHTNTMTWDTPGRGCALVRARKALFDQNKTLMLFGDIGTGKTQLAACLGLEYSMRHTVTGYESSAYPRQIYRTFKGLMEDQKETFDAAYQVGNLMKPCKIATQVDLLILDEVQEAYSEWEMAELAQIIDERYADRRPSILIGNLPNPEDFFAPATWSRLVEMGATLAMGNRNYRL